MVKRIYLTSGLGFSPSSKTAVLDPIVKTVSEMGFEVIEPFSVEHSNEPVGTKKWAYEVAKSNIEHIKKSDAIFVILNGTPPDEGSTFELGVAFALNKKIFYFRDDFRICGDAANSILPLNLMYLSPFQYSQSEEELSRHLFNSIEDIKSPEKALRKWAAEESIKKYARI
jgi:nucleoside 2-deoxyribosyltransferase